MTLTSTPSMSSTSSSRIEKRVSFSEVDSVHEVPCVLREGEVMVLKNANSSTRDTITDTSKLWYSARELSNWRLEAAQLVENVLTLHITATATTTTTTGTPSTTTTTTTTTPVAPTAKVQQQKEPTVCLRGLERMIRTNTVASTPSTVHFVLSAQERQRESGILDEEEIAAAGKTYSDKSLEEAVERAQQDFDEAQRVRITSEMMAALYSNSRSRSNGSDLNRSKRHRDSYAKVRHMLRKTGKGIQRTFLWSSNNSSKICTC
ncbi:hypothetical protein IV203_032472 [Nitzschia inconspicua]|uniref:Uncharacterized protein n=1 Tax=Nitzschia inconspicua TaxID=303405 RepID=A0A9K3KKF2_9STRA|nr:hypothetical protein IV203_032472 [Nitzschia inconspicua]